jgi:hypothetical protein
LTIRYCLLSLACWSVVPFLFLIALVSRLFRRPLDIGFGPEPLINSIQHAKALRALGWRAETYVNEIYGVTDQFDYRVDHWSAPYSIKALWLFLRSIFLYRALAIYFNGGPLGRTPIWRLEPVLYRTAGISILVMPYGSDVNDLRFTSNLKFKHANSVMYIDLIRSRGWNVHKRIQMWCFSANHVLSGCDWVDYTPFWDTLVPAHFTVEEAKLQDVWVPGTRPLRVFHATNHRLLKGTSDLEQAIADLQDEGFSLELECLEGVSNREVLEGLERADLVFDQIVIGWYGLFGLEAMIRRIPVLCHIRHDLWELQRFAGVILDTEYPVLDVRADNLKERLREVLEGKVELRPLADRGYGFAKAHHSLPAMGRVLDVILRKMGLSTDLSSIKSPPPRE